MTKLLSSLTIATLVFLFFGCTSTSKIETLKPEPDDAIPLTYENNPSYINLPITIRLKDIENKTNALLNGLIYEDNNIEDDNIAIKVWKEAPITISNANAANSEKIKTILPLKVWINYRVGTKKMGLNLYQNEEFNLNGVVTLTSDVQLNNWSLQTKTELTDLAWKESPSMVLLGKNVPITFLINPAVKVFRSKIEKKIDDMIEKSIDFKPNVMAAIEEICTPFEMSAAYSSWLRVTPLECYSSRSSLKKDNFQIVMGLKCYMETLIGTKPTSKFNKEKLILKSVTQIPQNITTNIAAVSSYTEASRILSKNFKGQIFGSGTKKVTVENVTLWHKNQKLIIALEVVGSVNGTIYLSGIPQYNLKTKELYFEKLDYVLDTKNKLTRTANWLLQGIILRKIEANCRYSIQPNLDEGKKNIMEYLSNYSPTPGVFINGKIESLEFQKIHLTNQAIIAFVSLNGNVKVTVDGLK